MLRYKSKYKKVGVLQIWKVKFNVSSVGRSSEKICYTSLSISATHQLFYISISYTNYDNNGDKYTQLNFNIKTIELVGYL